MKQREITKSHSNNMRIYWFLSTDTSIRASLIVRTGIRWVMEMCNSKRYKMWLYNIMGYGGGLMYHEPTYNVFLRAGYEIKIRKED